jgi:collagen type I/II/III/V/XI/XXIV/XXVII alpha
MGGSVSSVTWHIHRSNWSQSELTLFRNAIISLRSKGLFAVMEFGDTDEHEPWLVFCDSTGEVVAHFARLEGRYIACVPFMDETAMTASELSALLCNFLRRIPGGTQMQQPPPGTSSVQNILRSQKKRNSGPAQEF